MAQDNNETYYLFLFLKFSTTEPLGKVIKISVFTFQFKETKSVDPRQEKDHVGDKKKKKKRLRGIGTTLKRQGRCVPLPRTSRRQARVRRPPSTPATRWQRLVDPGLTDRDAALNGVTTDPDGPWVRL